MTTSFTQLDVWRKAHQNVLRVYEVTRSFPEEERFGLAAQMRRSAVSIPANIAEGYGRRGRADKARFYNIAQGSTEELKYYLILGRDLKYMPESEDLRISVEDVSRMLRRLSQSTLRNS